MVEDQSQFWDWRFNSRIHFRTAGSTGPAIVLVHGFGVASFQFQALMDELSKVNNTGAASLCHVHLRQAKGLSSCAGSMHETAAASAKLKPLQPPMVLS